LGGALQVLAATRSPTILAASGHEKKGERKTTGYLVGGVLGSHANGGENIKQPPRGKGEQAASESIIAC